MKKFAMTLPLILPMALAACGGEPPEPEPEIVVTQDQVAEQTIAKVVGDQFPTSSDIAGVANCAVVNASDEEIGEFAEATPDGVDQIITQNVLTVLARPSTRACIESNGIAPLK